MVILITGASHTGKTLLAQRLLERLHYPYLSIDHLKMGLIRSGYTSLTPADDDQLTGYLWPVVRSIIKTAIENRQHLIVEGCYVPYGWRQDFDATDLQFIRFVCLAMTDAYIDAHYSGIVRHASDIEARLGDTDCTMEGLKADNHAFIAGFGRAGERIALIDSDYEAAIRAVLSSFDPA
ncbi:MAG: adenylate kinase [Clostridia bacterium]|nr:adenylate kinase [Clostridia bacterium]